MSVPSPYESPRFSISTFLEEYRKFPCLWRKSDPDIKNRMKRDAAEKYLFERFGQNFDNTRDMRAKIRSIRGTYNQERNRVKKSMATGDGLVYRPKLVWYDLADSFLRENDQDMDSKSLLGQDHSYILMENEMEILYPLEEQDASELQTANPDILASQSQHQSSESDSGKPQVAPTPSNPQNRKRKVAHNRMNSSQLDISSQLDSNLDEVVTALKEVVARSSPTNEFNIFGNLVASQLQALPLEEAIRLQSDIQSLITSARLRNLHNSSSSAPPRQPNLPTILRVVKRE